MKDKKLPKWLSEWKAFTEAAQSKTPSARPQPPNLDPDIKEKIRREILKDQIFSRQRILMILLASVLSLLLATLLFD